MPASVAYSMEFREVDLWIAPSQIVWAVLIFCGYTLAAVLPNIVSIFVMERAVTSPQAITSIVLVPPISKREGIRKPCLDGCGDSPEPPSVQGVTVERNGLKLGVTDDPTFELLKVLRRIHGFIGFAPPEEPRYVDHLFDSSGSPVNQELPAAIDDYFVLLLADLTEWPDLRQLAEAHNIERSEITYILFPSAYWDVVADAIRAEASRQALSGSIAAATIRFDATLSSGVQVEKVVPAGL